MIVDFSIIVMLQAACHSWKGTLERFRFSGSEVGPFMLFPEVNLFEQPRIQEERLVCRKKTVPL